MRKRIIATLLILASFCALLPGFSVGAIEPDKRAEIKSIVTTLIEDYAKTVYQAESADEAFEDFLIHGFFGGSKDMILKESDPMVAAIFNANLSKLAFIDSISAGIETMQSMGEPTLLLSGGPGWHNFNDDYSYMGYAGDRRSGKTYLGTLANCKDATGSSTYQGPQNRNDELMHLLVGGLEGGILLRRVETREDTMLISVEFKLSDHFDFTGTDYKYAEEKGFDTGTDNRLNNIGKLFTYVGLKEFYWEFNKTLTIEVPNSCDHSSKNYRFMYDSESQSLSSDSENGFTYNGSIAHAQPESTDPSKYYFQLDETIILRHDCPWVIEYDLAGGNVFNLFPFKSAYSAMPYWGVSGRTYTWMMQYEFTKGFEGHMYSAQNNPLEYIVHYAGVEMPGDFQYSSKYSYTGRLENVLSEDGSNMVYLTVTNDSLGEIAYGPAPLTTHWTRSTGQDERVLRESETSRINGVDLKLNYIGSIGSRLRGNLDLRIYENAGSNCISSYTAPTCTAPGGATETCRDCGYSYVSHPEAALGHSWCEYIYDGNASCTADGTKTAPCSRCGEKNTLTAEGTAAGHSYSSLVTAPSCTEQGYTTHSCPCGESYKDTFTEAIGHSWGEGEVSKAPSADAEGEMTYLCTVCGEEKTEAIEKLPENPFEDVSENDYFYTPVLWALSKGITSGQSADTFGPAAGCTRAQVVTFLWRAAGKPAPESRENPFKDVSEGQYYYDAVLWAVEKGITTGLSADTFGPSANCNRGQIVTFLWRTKGEPAPESSENPFADVAGGQYYHNAVLWAVEKGITTGMSADSFAPNSTCTRGQIVTFLYRVHN